ncbi:unnamed protein product [Pleuronectes platessa]|uniref:Uncharacterized protein n=1 Tax=Pleuronectes platessa TaxID=8262 RepID=A0A9N7V7M4_PLEPL|nr:unnamed protein product [Pleuronectes platessa]
MAEVNPLPLSVFGGRRNIFPQELRNLLRVLPVTHVFLLLSLVACCAEVMRTEREEEDAEEEEEEEEEEGGRKQPDDFIFKANSANRATFARGRVHEAPGVQYGQRKVKRQPGKVTLVETSGHLARHVTCTFMLAPCPSNPYCTGSIALLLMSRRRISRWRHGRHWGYGVTCDRLGNFGEAYGDPTAGVPHGLPLGTLLVFMDQLH